MTVHSQAAQKWQSWWRGGAGRGVEAPRCSGKLWIVCCDREQMGEKKIYANVGKAATRLGVNTRAPGCKSILDPPTQDAHLYRCANTYVHACTYMCTLTQTHRDTPSPVCLQILSHVYLCPLPPQDPLRLSPCPLWLYLLVEEQALVLAWFPQP